MNNLNENAAGTAGTVTGRRDEESGEKQLSTPIITDNQYSRPELIAVTLARVYSLILANREAA
jgi:hypothetical protein